MTIARHRLIRRRRAPRLNVVSLGRGAAYLAVGLLAGAAWAVLSVIAGGIVLLTVAATLGGLL